VCICQSLKSLSIRPGRASGFRALASHSKDLPAAGNLHEALVGGAVRTLQSGLGSASHAMLCGNMLPKAQAAYAQAIHGGSGRAGETAAASSTGGNALALLWAHPLRHTDDETISERTYFAH